jgi:hypothetical protein
MMNRRGQTHALSVTGTHGAASKRSDRAIGTGSTEFLKMLAKPHLKMFLYISVSFKTTAEIKDLKSEDLNISKQIFQLQFGRQAKLFSEL